ncbi:HEAT repeat domain-containing protein [Streptomyces sp. NPDC048483]|uniref:HEAT repeat domain-containing protein n=1 Tax=Streptomyces sp. NPDC048483 TaxID=3154927 RepID=UPI003437CAC3
MQVTHSPASREDDPRRDFAEFLQYQARQSGLKVRDIAERFDQEARKEEEAVASAPGSRPEHPVREMAFSKSHIDRLFKAQALPSPPWPFTLQFLRITSRAAGLSLEEHQKRCAEARSLLQALAASSATQAAPGPASSSDPPRDSPSEAVAALRLEVELERARHSETRLCHALRDAQFLVTTLWRIISALRDIICSHDALLAQAHHGYAGPVKLDRLRDESRQALTHKHTAQEEANRAAARIRTLEAAWDQARADVNRLSLHPGAADLTPFSSDSAPPQPLLPQDLLAQPTLDDIAAALHTAQVLNTQEEQTVRDLQRSFTSSSALQPDDELAVLLAATRLPSNPRPRQAAAEALAKGWPGDSDARDALLRLTRDIDYLVRLAATMWLPRGWPGDSEARDALLRLTSDDYQVIRRAAAEGLARGWPGDSEARDTLLRLTGDNVKEVRLSATLGLAKGWPDAMSTRR